MRVNKFWFLVGFAITAGVSLAAEHGGGHGELESPAVLIWKGINIAIVVGALIYFFKDSFIQFVENYKNEIIRTFKEAEEKHAEALRELQEAKRSLEEAKVKYEEGIKSAFEIAQKEKEQIVKQAEEIAERIKQSAEKTIEVELNKAKEELRRYAAQKAIELSEKMLKDAFKDKELQKKFAERMLSELSEN